MNVAVAVSVLALLMALISAPHAAIAQDSQPTWPDWRTVAADMVVPEVEDAEPRAGRRVRYVPEGHSSELACILWLPHDWDSEERYPIFVELPGNGGYRDARGDECSGRPEDCRLGFGLTAGTGWIWVCLPFLNARGDAVALTWWGDAPDYDPRATLEFWKQTLTEICQRFQGDRDQVVLAGFSRGAIACNALGLHDDSTAALWTAFLPCSHYDGVRSWPFPGSDRAAAASRFQRLRQRPQLILGEHNQPRETRTFLEAAYPGQLDQIVTESTGFQNHSDQWALRPCAARTLARTWLKQQTSRTK